MLKECLQNGYKKNNGIKILWKKKERMDEIGKDLWKMGKSNWKMIVPDREKWRDLVKEAKGHLGL